MADTAGNRVYQFTNGVQRNRCDPGYLDCTEWSAKMGICFKPTGECSRKKQSVNYMNARFNRLLWPAPQASASGTLEWAVMAKTAGEGDALM